MKLSDREQIRRRLCRHIAKAYGGSQSAFAAAVGVSAPLVSFFVRGYRPVSGAVLRHLGYEAVTMYRTRAGGASKSPRPYMARKPRSS